MADKPRYFVDTRMGGITLRDRHHPKHQINMLHPLDYLAEDVIQFYMGYPYTEEGMKAQQHLLASCRQLNGEPLTLDELIENLNKEVV